MALTHYNLLETKSQRASTFILNERESSCQAASKYISALTLDTIKQWHFILKETERESNSDKCLEEEKKLGEMKKEP